MYKVMVTFADQTSGFTDYNGVENFQELWDYVSQHFNFKEGDTIKEVYYLGKVVDLSKW